MKGLLLRKKNLILQGAPGVGKTFAAERLAFSIMGEKDTSRVKVIQFHQSYSYEDFIMGWRPDGSNYVLSEGPFYKFCKLANDDDERPYFFIIDEINRGNLSKIFGELLMLIEEDKRNKFIRLLYKDELFSVPKNVHIIGMMNTADRSLAMIDYALRRRFAFYDLIPAFQSDGFIKYQAKVNNQKFNSLISTVERLNAEISKDASLGDGFRLGHSYFCALPKDIDDDLLNDVVEYELVPLLNEYWFDEPSKAEGWIRQLRGAVNG
jgi:5-methylcytosine-specific restriction endonuclease McrBC GTP-binding regulatory subunit McrB